MHAHSAPLLPLWLQVPLALIAVLSAVYVILTIIQEPHTSDTRVLLGTAIPGIGSNDEGGSD